ncbi:helix-turn-helix domain-containing protein [Haladaptatus sp. F3-133]|uniref:Helix-turn-helix domain-containing protein n=1 Tax=Halorutilus salinus TaxID=2487751 RepID=A0A9Q4C423_9EURY|nr:helix-turn-helix domain-containing protein [Halorutilus salinus]
MSVFATDGKVEEKIDELPPSAKLVFKVLEYNRQMTQKEISEETRLSVRTVRYALNRLTEEGIVEQVPCLTDGRQTLYDLNDDLGDEQDAETDAETEIAD